MLTLKLTLVKNNARMFYLVDYCYLEDFERGWNSEVGGAVPGFLVNMPFKELGK